LSGDGPNGVAGRLGPLPPRTAFSVRIRDHDTGRVVRWSADAADETDVGNPTGTSALSVVAPLGTAIAATNAFRGAPADESARMCAALVVREMRGRLRFCDRYVDSAPAGDVVGGGAALAGAISQDLGSAVSLVQGASFARLHITRMRVELSIARGLHVATMRSVSMRRRVRPGQRVLIRLRARRYRGRLETFVFRLRIPHRLRPGRRILVLAGPASDSADLEEVLAGVLGGGSGEMAPPDVSAPGGQPASRAQVTKAIRDLSRYDGVSAIFPSLAPKVAGGRKGRPVWRDQVDRITGALKVKLRVLKR
jgi:hypothetical protein